MHWKKLLSVLVIIASVVVVCMIAFNGNELENAWQVLFTLDLRWFLAALGAWFCYLFFDAMCYHVFFHMQGYRTPLASSLYYAIIGFFYSGITPGATGGQPMQVYEMNKRCIPVGVGTSAISVRFLMNQFVMVVMSLILIFTNRSFVAEQLGGVRLIYIAGLSINFIVIPLVLLVVIHKTLIIRICGWFIRLLAKLKLIKDPDSSVEKVTKTLIAYRTSFIDLCKKPLQIILQLIISILSMSGIFMVTYFVYRAFGLHDTPWVQILTVSALLFVSASYMPLPGGSGAQEGGFMVFFRGIFPAGKLGLALLVWRFITYYLFLLIGPLVLIVDSLRHSRRIKKIQGS